MFVSERVRVPLPLATAAVRLANLTRGGGLGGASRLAYQDGTEALLRVGPLGEVPGLAKLVRVQFLEPAWSERGMAVTIRGRPPGAPLRSSRCSTPTWSTRSLEPCSR
jgi:hypothetical protein